MMPATLVFTPKLIVELTIDVLGIIMGIVAIARMVHIKNTLGGKIGSALTRSVAGVVFIILAFSMTIVFTRLKLLAPLPYDVHHLLMAVGMLLFTFSAERFTQLLQ